MTREEAKQLIEEGKKVSHKHLLHISQYFYKTNYHKGEKEIMYGTDSNNVFIPVIFWDSLKSDIFNDGWEICSESMAKPTYKGDNKKLVFFKAPEIKEPTEQELNAMFSWKLLNP